MIKVYRAKTEDLLDIATLFDQYRVFYAMKSDTHSASKFIQARLTKNESIIFLAKHSTNICGFVQIYPAFSSVAMKPIWILNDLFVSRDFRKQGCAKKLMLHAQQEAKIEDIFSIKLATAIDNMSAKKLYESLNYSKLDSFDHYSLKI